MTHEFEVLRKCLLNGNEIHYFGDSSAVNHFAGIIATFAAYESDHPDIYFVKDKEVLIVEHFEFDSYPRKKGKGSKYRQEDARIERRLDDMPISQEGTILHDIIQGESSYENYIRNVTASFEKHYSEIEGYKETLKSKGLLDDQTSVFVLFFIQDISPLGSVVGPSGWDDSSQIITLAKSREFLDLLNKSKSVDYVLTTTSYESKVYNWFIDRAQLEAYYEQVTDYAKLHFIPFTPHVVMGRMMIPDNDLKNTE